MNCKVGPSKASGSVFATHLVHACVTIELEKATQSEEGAREGGGHEADRRGEQDRFDLTDRIGA